MKYANLIIGTAAFIFVSQLTSCIKPNELIPKYINSDKIRNSFKIKVGSYYIYRNLKNNAQDSLYLYSKDSFVSIRDQYNVETMRLCFQNSDTSIKMFYYADGFGGIAQGNYFSGITFNFSFFPKPLDIIGFIDPYSQNDIIVNPGSTFFASECTEFFTTFLSNGFQFPNVHHYTTKSLYMQPSDTIFTNSYFSETEGLIKLSFGIDTLLVDYELEKYNLIY